MDPSRLQPGYRLDRYELLCPLAYGGMASVWLARFGGRLGFERMVVVKMILPQYSQDPRFQEMFLDEARIASKIEHSNVARILDVGEHEGSYFIVMEWVDGDSLSKILREAERKKEKIPPGIALRICADAAAGLHAAHELKERDGTHLGVVHRDVSPQNILVANNGTTMIIDFGVAKARDRVSAETSAGQLKGKIRYMAPEQALGHDIDHRADVWAIGAMLYEMFAGRSPYDGPNEVAILHKLTSGQLPPPLPRSIPEVVRHAIERALGQTPNERFTNALELNLALEGAMVQIEEPTTAAIVAHYTGQLLAERKAARKRAVDDALDDARQREAAAGPAAGGLPRPMTGPFPLPAYPTAPPPRQGSTPQAFSGGLDLGEGSSAASAGTMGPAAMESAHYSPDGRLKRYVVAAIVGASLAAALVGAVVMTAPNAPPPRAPEPRSAYEPPARTDQEEEPPSAAATTATAPAASISAATSAALPTATSTSTATSAASASTGAAPSRPDTARPPSGGHRPSSPTPSKRR